jgi:protein RecA
LSQIEKQFGKGSIMKLGEQAIEADIPVIPTGSLGLDLALGVGGLPRGRVVEIYGPESSGKMTLALECIAGAQKRGGVCAFIDAEHSLDISYARKLGVSVEDLKRYDSPLASPVTVTIIDLCPSCLTRNPYWFFTRLASTVTLTRFLPFDVRRCLYI